MSDSPNERCGRCGHEKERHRKRSIAKLGEAFRVCIESTGDKAVCGCTVYAPAEVRAWTPEATA